MAFLIDIIAKAAQTAGFLRRQTGFFWAVIMLKIRIIGFDNKRNDLFMRLGKQVYSSNGKPGVPSPEMDTLIADIHETAREITEAEAAIIAVKKESGQDWADYYAKVIERRNGGSAS